MCGFDALFWSMKSKWSDYESAFLEEDFAQSFELSEVLCGRRSIFPFLGGPSFGSSSELLGRLAKLSLVSMSSSNERMD